MDVVEVAGAAGWGRFWEGTTAGGAIVEGVEGLEGDGWEIRGLLGVLALPRPAFLL
jgi:hypothetical protein